MSLSKSTIINKLLTFSRTICDDIATCVLYPYYCDNDTYIQTVRRVTKLLSLSNSLVCAYNKDIKHILNKISVNDLKDTLFIDLGDDIETAKFNIATRANDVALTEHIPITVNFHTELRMYLASKHIVDEFGVKSFVKDLINSSEIYDKVQYALNPICIKNLTKGD